MEKKEIIANLYTIKAGLSAISIEKDKIDQKQRVIDISDAELQENNQQQSDAQSEISRFTKELKETKEKLSTEQQKYTNQQRDIAKEERSAEQVVQAKRKKRIRNALIIASIFTIVAVIGVYILLHELDEDLLKYLWLVPMFIACFFALFLGSWGMDALFDCRDEKKQVEAAHQAGKSKRRNAQNYFSLRSGELTKDIKEADAGLATETQKLTQLKTRQPEIENALAEAKTAYKETVSTCLPVAQGLYNALLAQYHDFLDEREWEIVDLLIYYFETGRADTLKEALLHADQQRALDKIAAAVDFANENLCQTLERNVAGLATYLGSRIESLTTEVRSQTYQVVDSHRQMSEDISRSNQMFADRIESSISSLNASISSMAAQEAAQSAAQTAMLAKMRSDSRSLAKDVRFMMESDHHYYR